MTKLFTGQKTARRFYGGATSRGSPADRRRTQRIGGTCPQNVIARSNNPTASRLPGLHRPTMLRRSLVTK